MKYARKTKVVRAAARLIISAVALLIVLAVYFRMEG